MELKKDFYTEEEAMNILRKYGIIHINVTGPLSKSDLKIIIDTVRGNFLKY